MTKITEESAQVLQELGENGVEYSIAYSTTSGFTARLGSDRVGWEARVKCININDCVEQLKFSVINKFKGSPLARKYRKYKT